MTKDITILIPAYYEAPRIEKVLEVVTNYQKDTRIIVIDDGSPDHTSENASKFPVEVIKHNQNLGKGSALQSGIKYVDERDRSPYWVFLDADLINLEKQHIDKLLKPLEKDNTIGMSVGMFSEGGKLRVDLAQKYFGILNGQRALSREFVNKLPDLTWCRFGVEIFLSKYAKAMSIPVAYPVLEGITHHTKEEKFGLIKGVLYRIQMYHECLKALFTWRKNI
ncbi:glycosyltransferase family 2 protein [Natranaerofaba carboxydovora]|uniref:glycosyltransferase family 2 protein n=1 Tax=Natranaerofaba carboxydovora TaxID=2742683 RepID=UPI001F1303CD|nr:glycosyltransferase family 2 protein [Natranaerofaba carboxydovora]UMZ75487.1 Dodecaprenyl-phosphate galacturonate synthase [Natranaerofaba carboxydovora]